MVRGFFIGVLSGNGLELQPSCPIDLEKKFGKNIGKGDIEKTNA